MADLKSLQASLATLVAGTIQKQAARATVMGAIMPARMKPDVPGMEPIRWLEWFLRNHHNLPLIQAGVWKKASWVAEDCGEEVAAVAQAAFMTGGATAAWPILVGRMLEVSPPAPGQVLPDAVDVKIAYERGRDEFHPLGKRLRDK